jgi:uncharacterized protein YegJ (DUF2314 family)
VLTHPLADVEARHAHAPQTFHIPTEHDRLTLRVGDWAKVIFVFAQPSADGNTGERMWLRVVEIVRPGVYRGELDSEPHDLQEYNPGDLFHFEAKHVCAVLRSAFTT